MREHQLQLVDLEDLAVDVPGAVLPHAGGVRRIDVEERPPLVR